MNKIKAAREAAGLTQAEVFEALHIPMRTLQDWENDRRTPPEWAERLITEKLSLIARRTKGDIRMAEYMVVYEDEDGMSEVPFDDYEEAGQYFDDLEDDCIWAELRRYNDYSDYDVIGAIGKRR
jgi:hypothetical protein|nr:MAG TPA: putative transcriptional regulator [Caudoviricetes sp.]